MGQPEPHLTKPPERAQGRVYLHPALLVLVVFSFNMRFNAFEEANREKADLRVELEKCRGEKSVLEIERDAAARAGSFLHRQRQARGLNAWGGRSPRQTENHKP